MYLVMKERILLLLLVVLGIGVFQSQTSAQGGWRQWDLYLLDGSKVQANPLALKDGRFTRSMSKDEVGIDRSKISYIAAVANSLPPVPTGKFNKDLIVLLNGTRSLGTVTIKEIEFSEGMIVQNGKKLTLENVAYIKFAHHKKK